MEADMLPPPTWSKQLARPLSRQELASPEAVKAPSSSNSYFYKVQEDSQYVQSVAAMMGAGSSSHTSTFPTNLSEPSQQPPVTSWTKTELYSPSPDCPAVSSNYLLEGAPTNQPSSSEACQSFYQPQDNYHSNPDYYYPLYQQQKSSSVWTGEVSSCQQYNCNYYDPHSQQQQHDNNQTRLTYYHDQADYHDHYSSRFAYYNGSNNNSDQYTHSQTYELSDLTRTGYYVEGDLGAGADCKQQQPQQQQQHQQAPPPTQQQQQLAPSWTDTAIFQVVDSSVISGNGAHQQTAAHQPWTLSGGSAQTTRSQQQQDISQQTRLKTISVKCGQSGKSSVSGSGAGQRTNHCEVCGRNYARPSTLKTHLRTHTNERPFKCTVCSKTFSQAANLTAHQRVHTGERPFSCPICGRHFSQSSSVITHLRTHSGERPYRCIMCGRTFSDSSTLTKHCRIHSGEKPYQCDYCPLNFSQSGNLSRHLKLHQLNGGGGGSSSSSAIAAAASSSTSSSSASNGSSANSSSSQSSSTSTAGPLQLDQKSSPPPPPPPPSGLHIGGSTGHQTTRAGFANRAPVERQLSSSAS